MAASVLAGSKVFLVDIVVVRGSTNRFRMRWSADGAPVDMSGWTGRAQLRRSRASADAWLTLTGEVSLGPDGFVTIVVPFSATEGPEWDSRSRGVWDLELTLPSGEKRRLVEGSVAVSDEVTRG